MRKQRRPSEPHVRRKIKLSQHVPFTMPPDFDTPVASRPTVILDDSDSGTYTSDTFLPDLLAFDPIISQRLQQLRTAHGLPQTEAIARSKHPHQCTTSSSSSDTDDDDDLLDPDCFIAPSQRYYFPPPPKEQKPHPRFLCKFCLLGNKHAPRRCELVRAHRRYKKESPRRVFVPEGLLGRYDELVGEANKGTKGKGKGKGKGKQAVVVEGNDLERESGCGDLCIED